MKGSRVLVPVGSRWGTDRKYGSVLRPGLQWGMMGSNNHIITNSASALSDIRGIKESCRVHTRAASLPRCRALSHVRMCSFTHTHQHLSAWWDTIKERVHKHALGDTRSQSVWLPRQGAALPLRFCQAGSEVRRFTGKVLRALDHSLTIKWLHQMAANLMRDQV